MDSTGKGASYECDDNEGSAAITVRRNGVGSISLFNKKIRKMLGVRAPYGNHFKITKKEKKVLLVSGGTVLAPLLSLAVQLNRMRVFCTLIIGHATDALAQFQEKEKFDTV